MIRLKLAVTALALAIGVPLVMYLAGVFFFLANKANPSPVHVLTWFEYYRAYGFGSPMLSQSLYVALAIPTGLILAALYKANVVPIHGSARWAYVLEIWAAKLLDGDGIIVGKVGPFFMQFGGPLFVVLIAATRTGKGVGYVIVNLLNWTGSVVVLDIKLENFMITSGYRRLFMPCYMFNPFSRTTHRQNPFFYVSDDPVERVTGVQSIAYIFYPQTDDGNANSIWPNGARALFVSLSLFMLETDKNTATIGNILRHASGKGQPFKDHLQQSIESHVLSEECVNGLQTFIDLPDDTAGGILGQMVAALALWTNPLVDNATSATDFDIRRLRKQRMSVYVGIESNKLAQAGPILRLFFNQLISLNTDKPFGADGNTVRALLMLDEFPALGYMPDIGKGAGYMAGYGFRLLPILQSRGQIMKPTYEGGYGVQGAKALLDNHSMTITYTPKDDDDAKTMSELLGYRTVKVKTRQLRGGGGSVSETKRALMLPQEVRDMSLRLQIILMEGIKPILCKKIRYYEHAFFIDKLKLVSPSLEALGKRLPTEQQITDAWPELAAPVPTHDIKLATPMRHAKKQPVTPADVKKGIDLSALAIDIRSLPKHTNPMSDSEISSFADDYMAVIGIDESTEPPDNIDTSTGEIIDITKLRQNNG